MSEKIKKDYREVDLRLEASDNVIKMYMAMQDMMRNVYISCICRKVNYVWARGLKDYPKAYTLPYHEKYCLAKDKTGYTCKYGHVEYKQVPTKALDRVLWYAECDARRVLHKVDFSDPTREEITRKEVFEILLELNRKKNGLMYTLNRPVIAVPASSKIIQQALYGKSFHRIGTFMLPVVKWDVPIHPDSLAWLREHFPQVTCKVSMIFLYVSTMEDGKRVLCVQLRYENKFDPEDISAMGELVYHDPYVITHPNKTTPAGRYPMMVRKNNYKFEKPYDYYLMEVKTEAAKLLEVEEHTQGMSVPASVWLKASDICAKRYQDERRKLRQVRRESPDVGRSEAINGTGGKFTPFDYC